MRIFIVLLSGNAVAQLLTLLAIPLVTRLYSPAAFGELGGVLAISSVIATFMHGRLNIAIAKQSSLQEKQEVMIAGVGIVFLIGVISALAVTGLKFSGFEINYEVLLPAIAFAALLSFLDLLSYFNGAIGLHKITAITSVLRSLVLVMLQILFGLFLITASGSFLILAGGVALVVAAIFAVAFLCKRQAFNGLRKIELVSLIQRIGECKSYLLYSAPQGALAAFSLNSIPLVFSMFFSSAMVGFYWLAYRVLLAPIGLIGNAYRQAMYPVLANEKISSAEKLKKVYRHSGLLGLLSGGVGAVLLVWGAEVFAIIFGADWSKSGDYAGWLAICFGLDLSKIPVVILAQAYSYHRFLLAYEGLLALLRVSVVVWLVRYGDVQAIIGFSLVSSIFSSALIVFFPVALKRHLNSRLKAKGSGVS